MRFRQISWHRVQWNLIIRSHQEAPPPPGILRKVTMMGYYAGISSTLRPPPPLEISPCRARRSTPRGGGETVAK